jgi:hypothetical protein
MNEITPIRGETVWASVGTYGWRAAIVAKIGKLDIHLEFTDWKNNRLNKRGSRRPQMLRPRNPALAGKDKPSADEAGKPLALYVIR